MATGRQRSRCREHLERLGESTLDREALQLEAISVLRGVIGVGSRRELLARFGDAPGEFQL